MSQIIHTVQDCRARLSLAGERAWTDRGGRHGVAFICHHVDAAGPASSRGLGDSSVGGGGGSGDTEGGRLG